MASTADPSAPTNRLAGESSPYLRLHQHNPVDWYPWGEEALSRARREDKPIFLSVGYSTCYWCHVMERESFSHPEIAALMNERFVNIKVDREERPDLDEIYMTATQVLAGQGGWPNSVFLTPALKPFYAGTYFPPTDRWGRPGFVNLVVSLAEAWHERRMEVDLQADEVAGAMKRLLEERFPPGHEVPGPEVAIAAYRGLVRTFDHDHAGFGRAPKFPSPSNLFLLQALGEVPEAPRAAELLGRTLDAMARGGLYDQLGGGFHRYATDAAWQVPHFEKMLYDNALLLEVYALEAERRGGDEELERVVRETAEFLAREMTGPDGELWSAIDAETHGHEGAFYVWTREELDAVLGEEDAAFLAPLYGFDGAAFFEGDHYVLHLPAPVTDLAARRRTTPERLWQNIVPLRERLLAARGERERPATDDKVLADWNGMAIRGLAVAARVLGDPELAARAARAADYVFAHHRAPGQPLLHATHRGTGRIPAFLSDYVFFVRGLLALAAVTGESRFREAAVALTEEQISRLAHPQGGFYNAAAGADLLVRSQEILDGATPAANGVAVLNLLDLAALTGNAHYRELAERALATFSPLIGRAPDAARTLALACWQLAGASGRTVRPGLPLSPSDGPEWVTPRLTVAEPAADGVRAFRLELEIAPGWHINAHPASEEWLIPTEIEPLEGTELLDVVYPEAATFQPAPSAPAIAVYQGQVTLTGHLRGRGEFVFTYQPCDEERCLPPVRRVVG